MITYDRLWETMKKRGITQYHLIKREKFSAGQIGRLKNNMTVSTQTLDTLCRLLSCRIEDIVTYIPDNGETLPEQNPAVESISSCSIDTDANTDTGTDISKEKKSSTTAITAADSSLAAAVKPKPSACSASSWKRPATPSSRSPSPMRSPLASWLPA